MTASELATAERVQPQSLTRVLAALENEALISRSRDDRDRRRQVIELTEHGSAVLTEHVQDSDAWLARALTEQLTPVEREVLRLAADLVDRLLSPAT